MIGPKKENKNDKVIGQKIEPKKSSSILFWVVLKSE
jgi:hypothetical protein